MRTLKFSVAAALMGVVLLINMRPAMNVDLAASSVSHAPIGGSHIQNPEVLHCQALALRLATTRLSPKGWVIRLAAVAFSVAAAHTVPEMNWHHLIATLLPLHPEDIRRAQELISKFAHWRPTRQVPYPSMLSEHGLYDDLAATLAGRRPATICSVETYKVDQDPLWQALLHEARRSGLSIQQLDWIGDIDQPKQHFYVIGDTENVGNIIRLLTDVSEFKVPYNNDVHRQLGRWLGIPVEAIEDFVGSEQRTSNDVVHTLMRLRYIEEKELYEKGPNANETYLVFSAGEDRRGDFVAVRQRDGALFAAPKSTNLSEKDVIKHFQSTDLATILAHNRAVLFSSASVPLPNLAPKTRWFNNLIRFMEWIRKSV